MPGRALNLLALAFIKAEKALPLLDKVIVIPPFLFLALAALTSAGAFWARFIRQRNVGDDAEA